MLTTELLRPELQAALSAPGARAAKAACELVQCAAELAVDLTTLLPSAGPIDPLQMEPAAMALRFLGTACRLLAQRAPQRRFSEQQQRELAAAVLPAVPSFVAAMQAQQRLVSSRDADAEAAGEQPPGAPGLSAGEQAVSSCALTLERLYFAVALLMELSNPAEGGDSSARPHPITPALADVGAWAAGASCALQALPVVADLLPWLGTIQDAGLRAHFAQGPPHFAEGADVLFSHTGRLAASFAFLLPRASLASLPAAAELAAMLSTLWQLHTTGCRKLLWVAANPAIAAALWPMGGPGAALLGPLGLVFMAAHEMWAALRRRLEGEEEGEEGQGSQAALFAELERYCFPCVAQGWQSAACVHSLRRCAADSHPCRQIKSMHAAHYATLMALAWGAPAGVDVWDFDAAQDAQGLGEGFCRGFVAHTWAFTFHRVESSPLQWSPALQASVLQAVQRLPQVRMRRVPDPAASCAMPRAACNLRCRPAGLPLELFFRSRICWDALLCADGSPRLRSALLAAGFGERLLADTAVGGPLEQQARGWGPVPRMLSRACRARAPLCLLSSFPSVLTCLPAPRLCCKRPSMLTCWQLWWASCGR